MAKVESHERNEEEIGTGGGRKNEEERKKKKRKRKKKLVSCSIKFKIPISKVCLDFMKSIFGLISR